MSALRKILHEKALAHIHQDQFVEALQILKPGLLKHGPHVTGLIDLATCYYMLDEHDNFRKTTMKLKEEFDKCEHLLSEETYLRTCLGLGKLQEECGLLYEAYRTYSKVKNNATKFNELKERILVQKLRLKSQWNIQKDAKVCYKNFLTLQAESLDLKIELEHALMLAECAQFDLSIARLRFEKLILTVQLKKSDYRLFLFDLLFEHLVRGEKFLDFNRHASSLQYFHCDAFEKTLWDLHENGVVQKIADLHCCNAFDKMTFVSSLRILAILLNNSEVNSLPELRSMTEEAPIQKLNSKNRELVLNYFKSLQFYPSVLINLDSGVIFCGDRTLTLKKEDLCYRLLDRLSDHQEHSTENLIQELYNLDFNEFSYDRLRTLVNRIQNLFLLNFGTPKSVQLSKQTIQLMDHVKKV